MSKKIISLTTIAIIGVMLAACGNNGKDNNGVVNSPTADNTGGDSEKPFNGSKVSLFIGNSALGDSIKAMLPEFESETGVKVDVESLAEEQLAQKLSVQFVSGSNSPDVYMFRANSEGATFFKNGWAEPLDSYINNTPEFDIDDYSDSAKFAVTYKDQIMAIPGATAQGILYYRKDILEQAGLSVPATMDELISQVKQLHDPDHELYGFVGRGNDKALVSQIGSFLFSEGGDYIVDGKAVINSPAAVKAFSNYGMLLKDYGPPGVLNMDWVQAAALFGQGKAVFYVDGSPIHANFATADKSNFWDKIGYANIPAGDGGSITYNSVNWSLAMNPKSDKKDAAWYLMSWLMGKEGSLKSQLKGAPSARISVWEDPAGAKAYPAELVTAIINAQKNGKGYQNPPVINANEARDAVGAIVTRALTGGNVQEEADKQNAIFQAIIDKEQSE